MQPGTWRFLSDGGHTAQQERFLGKREWLRRSVALPGRLWQGKCCRAGRVQKLSLPRLPGIGCLLSKPRFVNIEQCQVSPKRNSTATAPRSQPAEARKAISQSHLGWGDGISKRRKNLVSDAGEYLKTQFSLEGKAALLTGGAGGIGRALALALCSAGAATAVCDLNLGQAEEVAAELRVKGLKAKAFALDLTNVEAIGQCAGAVAAAFGKIDILVNCAGINKREGFLDVEEKTYDLIMNVNLKGTFFMTQAVVPFMIKAGGGKIVNLSSHNAQGMLGGVSVYGASKSGVSALTRSMAIEWARFNIQANAVAPGHILTPLTQVTWDHPTRAAYLRERIAMRRPGTPEEVAGLVLMLCSPASSYMTGQTYHLDGGCLAGGTPWDFDTKYGADGPVFKAGAAPAAVSAKNDPRQTQPDKL
jgi:NAD(P)-dependent dehydrogenase (short-subunit alcohol dehydrogenase family)